MYRIGCPPRFQALSDKQSDSSAPELLDVRARSWHTLPVITNQHEGDMSRYQELPLLRSAPEG